METTIRAELKALRVVVEAVIATLPRDHRQRVAAAFDQHAMLVEVTRLNTTLPDEQVHALQTALSNWSEVLRTMDSIG